MKYRIGSDSVVTGGVCPFAVPAITHVALDTVRGSLPEVISMT